MIPSQPVSTSHLPTEVAQSYHQNRSQLVSMHEAVSDLSQAAFGSAQGARDVKASLVSLQRSGIRILMSTDGQSIPMRTVASYVKNLKDGLKDVGGKSERIKNDIDFLVNHQDKLMQQNSRTMRFVPPKDKMRFCTQEKTKLAERLLQFTSRVNTEVFDADIETVNNLSDDFHLPRLESITPENTRALNTASHALLR